MMLQINDVICKRGSFQLGSLNWQLPEGLFCCLVGPNGAGKSTLLQTLMGLLRCEQGNWSIAGATIQPQFAAWKETIGFAFDGQIHHERLSVGDNLALHASLRRTWDHELAETLREAFQLDSRQMVALLSRGQKQALSSILAVAHRPRFLLLDEITNGMDSLVRKSWNECIMQLMAESELTVLMATHVMSDVANLADRLVFMRAGRLIADVDKDTLLESWRQISCRLPAPMPSLPNARRWETRGDTLRFVSQDAAADLLLLKDRGASHIESHPLTLDEICSYTLEVNSHA